MARVRVPDGFVSCRYDQWRTTTGPELRRALRDYWALAASLHRHFAYVVTYLYDTEHHNHIHVDNGRSGSGRSEFDPGSITQVQAMQAIATYVWDRPTDITGRWDAAHQGCDSRHLGRDRSGRGSHRRGRLEQVLFGVDQLAVTGSGAMYPDNLTRDETRARAELIETSAYRIDIDLTGRGVEDGTTHFRSVSTVNFRARAAGTLHIDLIAESVVGARLDGTDLDQASFASSRLPLQVDAGEHELSVDAVCRFSRTGEGLHRFVDPADDRTYTYTQFEAADARRMFACFEQPDLKATFAFTVHAPEHWTVVSNGPEVGRTVTRRRQRQLGVRRDGTDLHLPDRPGRRRLLPGRPELPRHGR